MPGEYFPGPQVVQDVSPEAAYEPAEHGVHSTSAPAPLPLWLLPALHWHVAESLVPVPGHVASGFCEAVQLAQLVHSVLEEAVQAADM